MGWNREVLVYSLICAVLMNIPFALSLTFARHVPAAELALDHEKCFGLNALLGGTSTAPGGTGGYIRKLPKDPWGKDYQYRQPGQHGAFDIYSFGADGAEGGEGDAADIGSWQ